MATPLWKGTQALIEAPNSPRWVFGDSLLLTRIFSGPHGACLSAAPMKGAVGTGIASGYIVSESQVERQKGGIGLLTIQYTLPGGAAPGQGAQLPPDEVEIQNEKLERALQKHPRYAALSEPLLNHINILLETSEDSKRAPALAAVLGNALANNLYLKLKKGETHYIIYAPVYRIVTNFWTPPSSISSGGYLETPPSALNVALPSGLDWLREGDRLTFNGATWQLERKWVGVPDWDSEVYST